MGIPEPGQQTAVFTVVARNYLHYARVLMQSLRRLHPEWDRYVLLVDGDGVSDSHPAFDIVPLAAVDLPDRQALAFRYTVLEFSTAVKPWFFRHLFARGYQQVLYLDPDIYVYRPLRELDACWSRGALAVLVPHLTGRLRDSHRPTELDILRAGAYNLGFCALSSHTGLTDLLDYWCEKSIDQFTVDLPRGLFTDQRWMDLVPGMFPDVEILRHNGYDVAYWNVAHRDLTDTETDIAVNAEPLVFFHFSGVDPRRPDLFSRHQDRYPKPPSAVLQRLVREYCDELERAGLERYRSIAYGFGALADGTPIPDALRRLYRTHPEVARWAGSDPFVRTASEWTLPVDTQFPPLSRVMLAIYESRADLRMKWPDVFGRNRQEYVHWFTENARDLGVDARLLEPVRQRPHLASIRRKEPSRPRLVYGAARKAAIALKERRLPLSPRRWRHLYQLHRWEHAQEAAAHAEPLPRLSWNGPAPAPLGVSIAGYLQDATGLAAAAAASAAACAAADIPHELLDARQLAGTAPQHPAVLLHVNADQLPYHLQPLGPHVLSDKYVIGSWAWELAEFPDRYRSAFDHVDEVWVGSQFVLAAVAAKSTVPVVLMPYPVHVEPTALGRSDFGLPDDCFLFLTMYDALSVQERKNPLGTLAAFDRAFQSRNNVALAIRVNHAASRPADLAHLREHIHGRQNVFVIDQPFSRADAQGLMACCDAFVSLHRSEGFGLNIAEAMLLGKPVIVTGWSGNMDFTHDRNACLVDYHLTTLDTAAGPYDRGSVWAEPDVSSAAGWMVRLASDAPFRARVAEEGQRTVGNSYGVHVSGRRYADRLKWCLAVRHPARHC